MKRAAVIPALLAMVFAPIAPATPAVQVSPAAAVEACAMTCCNEQAPAAETDCAPSCRCPVSCVVPTHASAALPSLTAICPPASRAACPDKIADESAPVRTTRPPVPPPRA